MNSHIRIVLCIVDIVHPNFSLGAKVLNNLFQSKYIDDLSESKVSRVDRVIILFTSSRLNFLSFKLIG